MTSAATSAGVSWGIVSSLGEGSQVFSEVGVVVVSSMGAISAILQKREGGKSHKV